MRKAMSVGLGAIVLVAACGTGTLPTAVLRRLTSGEDHISTLSSPSGPPTIDAPDVVKVGTTFSVSFTTLETGCDVPDVIGQESDGASATLTPYNRSTEGPGIMCPAFVTWATRTTQVVFTRPGLDTVNVRGYLLTPVSLQLGAVTKTIQVSP